MRLYSGTSPAWIGWLFFLFPAVAFAQQSSPLPVAPGPMAVADAGTGEKLQISLADAVDRAKKLSPTLETALVNARLAAEATVQARAATLPTVSGTSQYLYTEGNGTLAARFIANNGVHEYIAQADVHQAISAALVAQYRQAALLQAVARDQATIAERGIVVTVVQAYSDLIAANGKLTTANETLEASRNFLKITQEREQNGDAAHADVLKASIQAADSQSGVDNAEMARDQARLALALLIFTNINQPFELVDDPGRVLALPTFDQVQAEAVHANPALDAALKAKQAAQKAKTAALEGYLPVLSFDYYYGIDANQFSAETTLRDGHTIQNLGYSALGSLNVPIFNWGATRSKVKQAESQEANAKYQLEYERRKAAGDLVQFYQQAQVAEKDMKIRQQAVADARESRELTLVQYKAGVATALDVVTAETLVDTENSAWLDAKTRYATAIANLATLTGVL